MLDQCEGTENAATCGTIAATGTLAHDPNWTFDSLDQGETGTEIVTCTIFDGHGTRDGDRDHHR
ncbi:MAG: hypothetical protein EOR81_12280 [Mesorhizobium sp.]|nr:MAG: hypothetical protein EOR81_12280 [Mesorhizobium sp.]